MTTRITRAALLALLLTGFTRAAEPSSFPPMPNAVASFGATACDGYLYVYGGHVGKTHSYDTKAIVGTFHRLKIDGGHSRDRERGRGESNRWEELPGGPIAQGMNLAAHGGKVYRVGGMQPRNKPGDPSDNHSLTDCARFDPATGKWEDLQPLPAGRSSHDVVVVGDKLVVVGGWQMKGRGEKSTWHDTALILDLSSKGAAWESIPQPFQRRALTATVVGSKVYVLGGLGAEGKPTDILDVTTRKWTTGPALPVEGKKAMSFSPAATTVNGRIVVNTAAGTTYRLTADGTAWEKVGATETPRVVARLVPGGPTGRLLGGATQGEGNLTSIEALKIGK